MNCHIAWGFLASEEVKAAGVGNLGLQDRKLSDVSQYTFHLNFTTYIERLAFKWIQKYISNFGGDPTKVTL